MSICELCSMPRENEGFISITCTTLLNNLFTSIHYPFHYRLHLLTCVRQWSGWDRVACEDGWRCDLCVCVWLTSFQIQWKYIRKYQMYRPRINRCGFREQYDFDMLLLPFLGKKYGFLVLSQCNHIYPCHVERCTLKTKKKKYVR